MTYLARFAKKTTKSSSRNGTHLLLLKHLSSLYSLVAVNVLTARSGILRICGGLVLVEPVNRSEMSPGWPHSSTLGLCVS